ncbi:MAG: FHA domain-containing protein [Pirellulaceae bacterium]
MSATASTEEAHRNNDSTNGMTPDFVEFQVDRVGHPRRRLRLGGHSYTFGSGEGCSVRLEDAGVRKTHAILMRQDDRLLIRGYGIAILVNGIRVTEAWLQVQDNIQLGQYTLTLLQDGAQPGSSRRKPNPGGDATTTKPVPPSRTVKQQAEPLSQATHNVPPVSGLRFGKQSPSPTIPRSTSDSDRGTRRIRQPSPKQVRAKSSTQLPTFLCRWDAFGFQAISKLAFLRSH